SKARPAVMIVHQWMGVTNYEERRARQLADLGYIAFVADIYGKRNRPTDTASAAQFADKYKNDRNLYRMRLKTAYDTMIKMKGVDAERTAVIGYCFGGTGAIEAARAGIPARGFVSFHGGLDSPKPDDGANIKGKVLVLAGADDPYVKPDDISAFKSEMTAHSVDLTYVSYPGAVHAFTQKEAGNDNSKGAAYNEEADHKSWGELGRFLETVFKDPFKK
ncbi:MAG: dienelactone hydrolase family protein, partial [Armatimonadota bacterium]